MATSAERPSYWQADAPHCEACGSPYLAWQIAPLCVLWRCPRCGHIERDLALAPAGARPEAIGGNVHADPLRTRLTASRLRRHVRGRDRGRVLEIGAGAGGLARLLAPQASSYDALEPFSDASIAAEMAALGVNWQQLGVTEAEFPPASFDLIVGIHVVEHIHDIAPALTRMSQWLAPGGVLYALTPNADSAALRTFGADWWMLEDPTHRRFFSAASARIMLESFGFTRAVVRPVVTDSLMCEPASLARRLGARGVSSEADKRVIALGLAATPGLMALRTVRPRWCAAIEIMAVKGTPAEVSP